jgi:hypothetical protein
MDDRLARLREYTIPELVAEVMRQKAENDQALESLGIGVDVRSTKSPAIAAAKKAEWAQVSAEYAEYLKTVPSGVTPKTKHEFRRDRKGMKTSRGKGK